MAAQHYPPKRPGVLSDSTPGAFISPQTRRHSFFANRRFPGTLNPWPVQGLTSGRVRSGPGNGC